MADFFNPMEEPADLGMIHFGLTETGDVGIAIENSDGSSTTHELTREEWLRVVTVMNQALGVYTLGVSS